jgi:hypothetical protein
MEVETFDGTLNAFKKRIPFKAFTVELVNGDRFEVDRAEALAVRDGVASYLPAGSAPVLFDREGVNQFIGDLMGQADM